MRCVGEGGGREKFFRREEGGLIRTYAEREV